MLLWGMRAALCPPGKQEARPPDTQVHLLLMELAGSHENLMRPGPRTRRAAPEAVSVQRTVHRTMMMPRKPPVPGLFPLQPAHLSSWFYNTDPLLPCTPPLPHRRFHQPTATDW